MDELDWASIMVRLLLLCLLGMLTFELAESSIDDLGKANVTVCPPFMLVALLLWLEIVLELSDSLRVLSSLVFLANALLMNFMVASAVGCITMLCQWWCQVLCMFGRRSKFEALEFVS